MPKTNTKQKLIDAASELIWRNSYGSVSVDDICKAADVRKGSFYHYFKSKVDLALASMENYYEQSKPFFDEAFSPTRPPLERFERLAAIILEKQAEARETYGHVCGCPFATLGSEMAGQEEIIREKANEIFGRYEKYYIQAMRELMDEGLLDQNIDIQTRANKLHAFGMGQALMGRIQNSLEPFKRDLIVGWMRILDVQYNEKERA
ncbi:MAG: TetR/AcrR family transcriptional regulator [Pseudomonadota bacterium]